MTPWPLTFSPFLLELLYAIECVQKKPSNSQRSRLLEVRQRLFLQIRERESRQEADASHGESHLSPVEALGEVQKGPASFSAHVVAEAELHLAAF